MTNLETLKTEFINSKNLPQEINFFNEINTKIQEIFKNYNIEFGKQKKENGSGYWKFWQQIQIQIDNTFIGDYYEKNHDYSKPCNCYNCLVEKQTKELLNKINNFDNLLKFDISYYPSKNILNIFLNYNLFLDTETKEKLYKINNFVYKQLKIYKYEEENIKPLVKIIDYFNKNFGWTLDIKQIEIFKSKTGNGNSEYIEYQLEIIIKSEEKINWNYWQPLLNDIKISDFEISLFYIFDKERE